MGFSSAGRGHGSIFFFELPVYSAVTAGIPAGGGGRKELLIDSPMPLRLSQKPLSIAPRTTIPLKPAVQLSVTCATSSSTTTPANSSNYVSPIYFSDLINFGGPIVLPIY